MSVCPELSGGSLPARQEFVSAEPTQLQRAFDYCKDVGRSALVRGMLTLGLAAGAGAVAGTASEMAESDPPAATANGGYPHANAKCLANGQTSGAGNWCNNYGWWVDENGNGAYNPGELFSSRGFSYRNCTDWAAFRVQQLTGILVPYGEAMGHGNQWDDNAPKYGYTVDTVAEPGDIAVWNAGTYGHVEVVESVNPDGSVNTSGYNRAGSGEFAPQSNVRADKYIDLNGTGKGINGDVIAGGQGSPAAARPAAVVRGPADMNTFYRGVDNKMVSRYWSAASGWASVSWPINVASAPSALARTATDLDVFYRSTGNNLVDHHWTAANGWVTTELVTDGSVTGNPVAIARSPYEMDVFYRKNNGELCDAHWNAATSWALTCWPDNIKGDPSPTSRSPGIMDVFFRDTADNLIDRNWNVNTGWAKATVLSNGSIGGDPAAVTPNGGSMNVFYRDKGSGNLYARWWTPSAGWNTTAFSLAMSGTAAAISRSPNSMEVFVRSPDSKLYAKSWNGNAWSETLLDGSGTVATDPAAIDRTAFSIEVFYGRSAVSGTRLAVRYWNPTNGWQFTDWPW